MIRYIKIFLFLCCMTTVVAAQQATRRTGDRSFFNHPNANFRVEKRQVPVQHITYGHILTEVQPEEISDTLTVAIYTSTVKQYGWMRGLGEPISEEASKHLNSYYRFSRKNKAGHWTRMECFDSYGKPSGCGVTYLINPFDNNDKNIDEEWRKKLKKIVRWEFVGDKTGEHCIQENAYDEEGNLVLGYIPVQVGEGKYMGHYVDVWGMPAKMRDNEGAKFVLVQWDSNGYEAEVSFIGDDGFPKKNNWGAYKSKYVHDVNGFRLSNMSCNVDGNFMIDASGNSGQRIVYNEKGLQTSVTNYGADNEIMRVQENERMSADYIQEVYEYDDWGRQAKVRFFKGDGLTPDTTRTGLHEMRYEYDDHGNCTLIQCYGLHHQPVNHNSGYCRIIREYDEQGNNTYFEARNAEGKFFNYSICMQWAVFDGDSEKEFWNYETTDGTDTLCITHFFKDENRNVWEYPQTDMREIYTYDDEGNLIEEAYYHLDGKPRRGERGFHRWEKIFSRQPGFCRTEQRYLNEMGELMSLQDSMFEKHYELNRLIILYDSIRCTQTFQRYIGSRLLQQYQQQFTPSFAERQGERGMDIMGVQARNHYTYGLYFESYLGNSIKGSQNTAYVGITNEYGEPSYYISIDSNTPSVYAYNPYGESFYMDEDGAPISNMSAFRDSLPRAYIIEVYDSIASTRWGVQSGDVIMQLGEWMYPELTSRKGAEMNLRQETFLLSRKAKKMVVMRRNPATNQPEVKEILLGKGTLGDFGFYFHRVYCTRKEKQRYADVYANYQQTVVSSQTKPQQTPRHRQQILFMRPYRSYGEKRNIYGRGTVDDAIVLGFAMQDNGGRIHQWQSGNVEHFDSCRNDEARTRQKIWFTTDLRTVRSLELYGDDTWDASFWYDSLDQRNIGRQVQPLFKRVGILMEEYLQQRTMAYADSMKAIYGNAFRAVKNDSVEIVLGRVEGYEGYMPENGYTGLFIVLDWCGWKCIDPFEEYLSVYKAMQEKPKKVALLPVGTGTNGSDIFYDIVHIDTPQTMMGLRLNSIRLPYSYFKEKILKPYEQWLNKQR